jgi:DHA2 family multidrug resistance protein
MLGTIVTHQLTAYQDAARNDLHNAATALGQRFLQLVQLLQMRGLPAVAAQKAAEGQLLGSLVPQQFMQSINDAYIVTFWLALAVALLALTLPGRSGLAAARAAAEEGVSGGAPSVAPASGAQAQGS